MESLKSFCQSCNFNEDKINKFILNKILKTYYVEIRRIKVDKGDGWTLNVEIQVMPPLKKNNKVANFTTTNT